MTERGDPDPPPDWLVATVADLRALGFFADPTRDDVQVARDLAGDHQAEWGSPPDPDDDHVELELTRWDDARVWWEDTEADVCPANRVYEEWIHGLTRIARGALLPARITERWGGDEGPVHVRVDLPSGPLEIGPHYLEDYVDIETVLRSLNGALPAGGPRFVLYLPFDQTAFVTCVTVPERRRLEERGWSFAPLD